MPCLWRSYPAYCFPGRRNQVHCVIAALIEVIAMLSYDEITFELAAKNNTN